MFQIAEIVFAIIGLCGGIAIRPLCWCILACEFVRFFIEVVEMVKKKNS